MAAVSATFVTCRATGAGAKAARASNGAAARAPVAMTSKTNGVSLGARQGSRVSARAAAPARSARRVALAAVHRHQGGRAHRRGGGARPRFRGE